MSDVKQTFETKLKEVEKGLYLLSAERERALSNHETVDLIEELRGTVAELQAEVNKL